MKRIKSLDTIKAIAAWMVIFLHFSSNQTGIINAYFRIAVALFFMISGYFLYKNDKVAVKKSCTKNCKKLIVILFLVNGLLILKSLIRHNSISDLIETLSSWEFLLFNFKFAAYMWFVRALIYIYAIVWIIKSFFSRYADQLLLVMLVVFVFLNLILCKYSLVLFNMSLPVDIYEIPSKLFGCGYVFFVGGYLIKKYESYIMGFFSKMRSIFFLFFAGGGTHWNISY